MQVSPFYIDALTEILNMGVGQAADLLNQMLHRRILLKVPSLKILSLDGLVREFQRESAISSVCMGFNGAITGYAMLAFPPESAAKVVSAMTGEEIGSPDLDAVAADTLSEVGNIILNGIMGVIGNTLQRRINYSLPNYSESAMSSILTPLDNNQLSAAILAQTRFEITDLKVEGDIILLFGMGSLDTMLTAIDAISGN